MSDTAFEFSRPVRVTAMGKAGLEYSTEATDDECAAIADRLDVVRIQSLKADIRVTHWRKGGAHLTAQVQGRITRRCVVSLEPFEAPFAETVDVYYADPRDKIGTAPTEGELIFDPESDEPPEVLEEEGFDVGETILQHLVLSLDPYPRRPGVEFDDIREGAEKTSPFSVLSGLRDDGEEPPEKA